MADRDEKGPIPVLTVAGVARAERTCDGGVVELRLSDGSALSLQMDRAVALKLSSAGVHIFAIRSQTDSLESIPVLPASRAAVRAALTRVPVVSLTLELELGELIAFRFSSKLARQIAKELVAEATKADREGAKLRH